MALQQQALMIQQMILGKADEGTKNPQAAASDTSGGDVKQKEGTKEDKDKDDGDQSKHKRDTAESSKSGKSGSKSKLRASSSDK